MAGTSQYIAPVKSEEQVKALAYELGNFGLTYKGLFLLSIETGLWFHEARNMKVSDLKDKPSVTSVRHGKEYTFPMSDALRSVINELSKGKSPDDYIFVGTRTKMPVHTQSYVNALLHSSEACGISPAVNMKSIVRSFVYFLYLKDTTLAMDYANKPTVQKMHDYLKIKTPEDTNDRISLHSTKSNFIKFQSSDSINIIQNKVLRAFEEIKEAGSNIESIDSATISKAQKYLGDIESLTDLFLSNVPFQAEEA